MTDFTDKPEVRFVEIFETVNEALDMLCEHVNARQDALTDDEVVLLENFAENLVFHSEAIEFVTQNWRQRVHIIK